MSPSAKRRALPRILVSLTLFILFAALIAAALYYYYLRTQKLPPTVVNWRAKVTTLAGDGAPGTSDGPPAAARFADPFGIAVDRAGNVYVADAGESNRLRKITPEGIVSTLAGGAEGFADGTGPAAAFNTPSALAIDEKGNLYVADTGNHAIRRVTPEGVVTTLVGDGTSGYLDGPARTARFNAPVGVAVDQQGNVYVADTYNDRIRLITADAQVQTIAGGNRPGYADGAVADALFDTPCALVVSKTGDVYVADTGNSRLRVITRDSQTKTTQVSTLALTSPDGGEVQLETPLGLALTHDNFLYLTEGGGRARVLQVTPARQAFVIAGIGRGYADGEGQTQARFNRAAGAAVDRSGELYTTDAANYLIRKLSSPVQETPAPNNAVVLDAKLAVPRLTAETLGITSLLWPVDPQGSWHEVTGTMGEVRGSYSGENRDHFHSGVDVQGGYGAPVRAVRDEKVAQPLANWGLGGVNEGMSVGVMTYIHQRVGRNERDEPFRDERFVFNFDEAGKITRLRVRRGARFHIGDQLGTINRMYHVHLNLGPWSAEVNPLTLPLADFSDARPPVIERDGIQLFSAARNERLTAKNNNRVRVPRGEEIKIVVDAYDQVDKNLARRRLGLYRLGYQLLKTDGTPAPGYEAPRITMQFDRLPVEDEAVKIAYADASGITVYGSAATRFLYEITNIIRDGHARADVWRTTDIAPGNYQLRVIAADYAGNEAITNRELAITVE